MMNNLSNDLLTSIFVRVSVWRILTRLRAVCRRWNSLIADPHFLRAFTSHQPTSPCGFLIQHTMSGKHHSFQNCQLFMDEFLNLRPRPAANKNMRIVASFDDLLLLSSSSVQYFIQNPTTKQLTRLPEVPTHYDGVPCAFGLAVKGSTCRAVLFHRPCVAMGGRRNRYVVRVYCSKTLKWARKSTVREATRASRDRILGDNYGDGDVVCCGGVMYWKHTSVNFVQSILRFDPFKRESRWGSTNRLPCHDLPADRPFILYKLCIGESQGRLRICRMSFGVFEYPAIAGIYLGMVFEVWEVAEEELENGLNDDTEWGFVHRSVFDMTYRLNYLTANFHPNDGRFVFLYDYQHISRYNMTNMEVEVVGEIPQGVSSIEDLTIFPISTLPRPTTI